MLTTELYQLEEIAKAAADKKEEHSSVLKRDSRIHDYAYGYPGIESAMSGIRSVSPVKSCLLSTLVSLATSIDSPEVGQLVQTSKFEIQEPEIAHGQLAEQLYKLCVKLDLPQCSKFVSHNC